MRGELTHGMGSEYGGSRSGRSHSMLGPIDQGSHRSQDTLPSGSGMMSRAFSIQHDGDQQGFDTPGSSEVSRPSGGNLRGRDVSSQLPTGASSAPDPTPMRLLAGAPKKSLSRTRRCALSSQWRPRRLSVLTGASHAEAGFYSTLPSH